MKRVDSCMTRSCPVFSDLIRYSVLTILPLSFSCISRNAIEALTLVFVDKATFPFSKTLDTSANSMGVLA